MTVPNTGPQTVKLNLNRSTGVTVFQTKPARIEWTAQDRIRVIDLDPTGNPAGEQTVFDAAPNEITKARYWAGNPGQLTFWKGTEKVRVNADTAMPSPEPWESLAQYNERLVGASVPPGSWWIDRLKTYGVNAKAWTYGKVVGFTLLGMLVLIAAIAALVLIFD